MKLAELTKPLAPHDKGKRPSTPKAKPKNLKNVVSNPEQSPQEPKHRMNDRDRVRQNMSGNRVGKR